MAKAMVDIDRGIVGWTGGQIGSGATVMYAKPGGSFMAAMRTFFNSAAPYMGAGITLSFPSSGDTVESTTGVLTGGWGPAGPFTNVVGSSGGNVAAPAGCSVTWTTSTIVPGYPPNGKPHHARGRTFIVPLGANAYDADGTITSACFTAISNAANALVTAGAGHFVVWHRPSAPGATDGVAAEVTGYKLKDRVSVLTSRR